MDAAIRTHPLKLGALALIATAIALSWLVFPYFVHGQQLLRGVGDQSRDIKAGGVSRYLTRSLVFSPELEITATYASDEYFQYVDKAAVVRNLRPDRNFVFFVSETIHRGDLPGEVPHAVLKVGDREYLPEVSSGPSEAEHHRLSVFSFSKRDASGERIDIDTAGRMRLFVSGRYLGSERPLTFIGAWDAPYGLPDDLRSGAGITPIAVLALGAGLLSSVLTPCLLQLVVIFGSVIAGFASVPGSAGAGTAALTPLIRRKLTQIAAVFVAGFVLLYALAGALIGAAGHQAQLVFAEHSRTVAVLSGLLVIGLGLWVGLRGRRARSCPLPDRALAQASSWRDLAGTLCVSMGYALGCTACFGGAIVGTLLVYVGAIGSAAIGASVMLTFAVGVAIPFLLSAYYLSRTEAILGFIARHERALGIASMVLIVSFGMILVTDNFHAVSDLLYPYLGLG
jgi:cytochrome c-type biogenesis protein